MKYTKYTPEQKRQLVHRYQSGESVTDICTETGVSRSTFYSWIKLYQVTVTESGTVITPQEHLSLKRRVEKQDDIIKVLKAVNCTVSSPLQDKLYALESLYEQYSVHTLCEALEVPRGTFYNHVLRNKKQNKSYRFRREELSGQIRQIYDESHQIYGAKKIKAVLETRGVFTSVKMITELMNEMNLSSIRTVSKQTFQKLGRPKKTDKLKLNFSVSAPNQVWVSDVTYFNYNDRFYYICAVLDLYSRKAIAYKISLKHSAQLISTTFKAAYKERQPSQGLIIHSDRGVQYTSYSFEKLLTSLGVEHSFSPAGKPSHNAVMESFFSSMKREELYRTNYRSVDEFKEGVARYIQFYNNERPHSVIGYKTPNAYETAFYERKIKDKK